MSPFNDKVPNNQEVPLNAPLSQPEPVEPDLAAIVPDDIPQQQENVQVPVLPEEDIFLTSEFDGTDILSRDETVAEIERQTGEPISNDLQLLTVQLNPSIGSFQWMHLFSPNLRILNIDNSEIISLRELSSNLRHLRVIHANNCGLTSLDGISSLTGLREVYASNNFISQLMPCSSLKHLSTLDVSNNNLQNLRSLSFLTYCEKLHCLRVEGNPLYDPTINFRNRILAMLPQIKILDGCFVDESEIEVREEDSSSTSTEISARSSIKESIG